MLMIAPLSQEQWLLIFSFCYAEKQRLINKFIQISHFNLK
jgi:hypothetical protein